MMMTMTMKEEGEAGGRRRGGWGGKPVLPVFCVVWVGEDGGELSRQLDEVYTHVRCRRGKRRSAAAARVGKNACAKGLILCLSTTPLTARPPHTKTLRLAASSCLSHLSSSRLKRALSPSPPPSPPWHASCLLRTQEAAGVGCGRGGWTGGSGGGKKEGTE